MTKGKCYFNGLWLEDPQFYWAQRAKSTTSCYCTCCKKEFDLSNMGKTALISHQSGKNHKKLASAQNTSLKINNFFDGKGNEKENVPNNKTNKGSANSVSSNRTNEGSVNESATGKQAGTANVFCVKEDSVRASIIWSLGTVYSHLPISSSVGMLETARLAFPDSDILCSLKLDRTKLSYTIVHGLGPFLREKLEKRIEYSTHFSIAFDESFNKISKTEQLDIIVRLWDVKEQRACSRYLTSSFLGHTKATDILSGLTESIQKFNLKHLTQLSMDGPNVNKKVLKDLKIHLSEIESNFPELLDIGTCGLHTLNNSFQTSIKETNWRLIQFLRTIYYLFNKSSARRADYIALNKSEHFPDKYCEVRWLNNRPAAETALKLLDNLKEFVNYYKEMKKSSSIHDFDSLDQCLKDPLLEAKLQFFISICSELEPFLKLYQTERPMVSFLYDDLKFLIKNLMEKFVKKTVLSADQIVNVDVNNSENIVNVKDIDLGYGTRNALKKSNASVKDVLFFKSDCMKILKHLVNKLLEKSPIKSKFLKSLSFCNPMLIATSKSYSFNRFKSCLEFFIDKGRISALQADKADKEFRNLLSGTVILDKCKQFKKETDRLDTFWVSLIKSRQSEQQSYLLPILQQIFVMFHGNADVERGFSVNKHCLIVNQSSQSLIAQRLVYDEVLSIGGVQNFEISKDVIRAAMNARRKYEHYLEMQKKERTNSVQEYLNKKRKAEKLVELNSKRRRLEQESIELALEIDSIKSS